MAHAKIPDFAFRRNGRVHLNRRSRQFSRLLAAEVCASAVLMLDTPCSEVECKTTGYPLHSLVSPFISPPGRHRVPSHFSWTLQQMPFPSAVRIPRFALRMYPCVQWYSHDRPEQYSPNGFCNDDSISCEARIKKLLKSYFR